MNLLVRQGRSWSGRERNCCFLNTHDGGFSQIASVSGLDSDDDARAVAVTDWDQDGRSDLWISSRTAPRIRFFHNRNETSNNFIAFALRGVNGNRDAIGARLELYLGPDGTTKRIETLRCGEGFLSQSSKWVSFGIGKETDIDRLVVRWPGGEEESFSDLVANNRYQVVQGTGKASRWARTTSGQRLAASPIDIPEPGQEARIVTLTRPRLPHLEYTNINHETVSLAPENREIKAILVSLWSSTCVPCLQEMKEFADNEKHLRDRGLDVVALCVDRFVNEDPDDLSVAKRVIDDLHFPFRWGVANDAMVSGLDTVHQSLVDLQKDLPIPCSFLIQPSGELAVLYKGRVNIEQLVDDVDVIKMDANQLRDAAVPFEGIWITKPIPAYPQDVALKLVEQGKTEEAIQYLRSHLKSVSSIDARSNAVDLADIYFLLGRLLIDQSDVAEGMNAYRAAIRINPNYRKARINLADLLLKQKQPDEAIANFEVALKIERNDPNTLVAQGVAFAATRNANEAIRCYRTALRFQPDHRQALTNLARLVHARGNIGEAVSLYRQVLAFGTESPSDANNLAWILATDPDSSIRNPTESVRWAELACRLTDHKDPRFLTTLAAAYSEAKRFKDAVLTANTAIRSAYAAGQPKIAAAVERHLRVYEDGKTYREGRQK